MSVTNFRVLFLASCLLPLLILPSQALLNGSQATIGEIPWTVSIARTSHLCGGTIISKRTILTAASCVDSALASALKVRAGSLRHASGGTLYSVSRILRYPTPNGDSTKSDAVALLVLASDVALSPDVSIAALSNSRPATNTNLTLAGWGATAEASTSPVLIRANEMVLDSSTCQSLLESTPEGELCAARATTTHGVACHGDVGASTTMGSTVFGLVGSMYGCGDSADAILSVTEYRTWITNNIQ